MTFFSSGKSKDGFTILGNWIISMVCDVDYTHDGGIVTFAGSQESGSVSIRFPPDPQIGTGTFTVNDNEVTFTIYWPRFQYSDTCKGTVVNLFFYWT